MRNSSLVGGHINYDEFVRWAKNEADKLTTNKEKQADLEFQWAENIDGIKIIVYKFANPIGYVGLENFEDGNKITTLGIIPTARGEGIAEKLYKYIVSKTILYSDKIQTPEARKLWARLFAKYPVKGFNKTTHEIFEVEPNENNSELKSLNLKYDLYSEKENDNYLVIGR